MTLEPRKNWNTESVLAQLREQAKATGTASAQVFLSGSESDVSEAAHGVLSEIGSLSATGMKPAIGRISTLAKSFSLTADPSVFDALAHNPRIKSILPSAVSDVYPKPTKIVRDPPG